MSRGDPSVFHWTEIERLDRVQPDGTRRKCVRARCACGVERIMIEWAFDTRVSLCCKRCHIRNQRAHGHMSPRLVRRRSSSGEGAS